MLSSGGLGGPGRELVPAVGTVEFVVVRLGRTTQIPHRSVRFVGRMRSRQRDSTLVHSGEWHCGRGRAAYRFTVLTLGCGLRSREVGVAWALQGVRDASSHPRRRPTGRVPGHGVTSAVASTSRASSSVATANSSWASVGCRPITLAMSRARSVLGTMNITPGNTPYRRCSSPDSS